MEQNKFDFSQINEIMLAQPKKAAAQNLFTIYMQFVLIWFINKYFFIGEGKNHAGNE